MRKLALTLALLMASGAQALQYEKDGLTVTLHSKPCEVVLAAMILSTATPTEPKAATVVVEGKIIEACWAQDDRLVYIADENGNGGYLEAWLFK